MVDGTAVRWRNFFWRRELRQILEAALRSGLADVIQSAGTIRSLSAALGDTD